MAPNQKVMVFRWMCGEKDSEKRQGDCSEELSVRPICRAGKKGPESVSALRNLVSRGCASVPKCLCSGRDFRSLLLVKAEEVTLLCRHWQLPVCRRRFAVARVAHRILRDQARSVRSDDQVEVTDLFATQESLILRAICVGSSASGYNQR